MCLKALLLGLIWVCHSQVFAQTKIQKLPPGSHTPDVKLKTYIGDKSQFMRLRDLKSRLVILDYWSEYCSSCIFAMPKLDSLQKVFGDSVTIILVTQQAKPGADKLFKNVTFPRPHLMMVFGDTVLRKFFPHNSVPHHVWLEPRGTIRYIASGYNTTGENIRQFLSGKDLHLVYKNEQEDFDSDAPFLSVDNGSLLKGVVRYSALLRKISEYGGSATGFVMDTMRSLFGIKMINTTLLSLYKTAYSETFYRPRFEFDNKIKLEVKRPERFQFPEVMEELDTWSSENVYCYESRMKCIGVQECFDQMKTDLLQSLPYVAEVKKMITTSYVLIKFGEADLLATQFPLSKSDIYDVHLRNASYQDLVIRLQEFSGAFEYPLSFEYQYEGNIDFDWPVDQSSHVITVEELRPYLQKRGLDLIKKEAPQEMLVIRDK